MNKKKLIEVASKAAMEATARERQRCIWCCTHVVRTLQEGLSKKVLLSPAEEHGSQMKLELVRGLSDQIRSVIAAGLEPVPSSSGGGMDTGSADG
ncbi:MAG: hypothetical protein GY906_23405 [bacterium]|nr:hypothetical protein [bacterium]